MMSILLPSPPRRHSTAVGDITRIPGAAHHLVEDYFWADSAHPRRMQLERRLLNFVVIGRGRFSSPPDTGNLEECEGGTQTSPTPPRLHLHLELGISGPLFLGAPVPTAAFSHPGEAGSIVYIGSRDGKKTNGCHATDKRHPS